MRTSGGESLTVSSTLLWATCKLALMVTVSEGRLEPDGIRLG